MSEYQIKDLEGFKNTCEKMGVSLTDRQLMQFLKYYELLVEWNQVMNLTAITEFQEVLLKHFADSLALVPYLKDMEVRTLIDVGTGAGFPGIPLKIACPFLKVTLLDSLNKRLNFLNQVIDELELSDIETVHGRAEDFGKKPEFREIYDVSVSRAVANLSTLTELCSPFVKVGGFFIPYKSEKTSEEIAGAVRALSVLKMNLKLTKEYALPDSDLSRTLLFIQKEEKTPKAYPRKAGTPAKQPL